MSSRLALGLGLLLIGCGPPAPARPSAPPPRLALAPAGPSDPPPAPPPDPFVEACPTSDVSHRIHLLLELDGAPDWSRTPEDVTNALLVRLGEAAKACDGASVSAGPDGRSLSAELPKACGPDAVRGKLELTFPPAGGRDFATARFDGQIGDASLAGRAYLDPSKDPKRACLSADLERLQVGGSKHPSAADAAAQSLRIQRAMVELFFRPLLTPNGESP